MSDNVSGRGVIECLSMVLVPLYHWAERRYIMVIDTYSNIIVE